MSLQINTSARKGYWKSLHGKQKIRYIWDYFKLPIAVCLIVLYILSYTLYGHLSEKETLLYVGLVNLSAGEQLTGDLSQGFLDFMDADAARTELKLYPGLYLTDNQEDPNHEYTYASRIKIMAAIDDEQLDLVLMNKEAFNTFSKNGYLCNLDELLRDLDLGTAKGQSSMGIRISHKGPFKEAGFSDDVYLGVIKNSPRMDMAAEYITYLYSDRNCRRE